MSKDNFYEELDQDRYDTHHFVIYLIVIFILIAVLGSILSIWLVKNIRSKIGDRNISATMNLASAKSQFLSFLPFAGIENQSAEVTLNDDQLTTLLNARDEDSKDKSSLEDMVATISPQDIAINGTLIQPVKTHVQLKVLPKVSQGQLKFDIISVKVARINLPGLLKESLTPTLNQLTLKALNSSSIKYESVELSNHEMVLKGEER